MTMLRAFSRLPLSLWLRGLAAALALVALLAFGLAVIAAVLVAVGLGALIYKARDWVAGGFRSRRTAPAQAQARGQVTEAEFIVIERR